MSTNTVNLKATARTVGGKSEARRLRTAGQIPAIAYGKGLPATAISVWPKEVAAILTSERGKNTVIKMNLDGKPELLVMIRDYAHHPVKRSLEHVDFVEVKLDRPVDVHVPLIATGKASGVTKGGLLRQVFRTVPLRCVPDKIPLKIEVDVSHLELGEHIATKDLKLGEGVSALLTPELTLIAVVTPEKDRSEEEEAAAAGAAGAAAPGAPGAAPGAAAPAAAGGAAPAAAAGAKDAKAPAAAPAKDAKKK
jgi:large subunit ribosomal protein L25